MESATLPSASLVTFPRSVKSPRATWLMTVSSSVMLRCNASLASWLLVSFETLATARFRFSAMKPSSSFVVTSARARGSPAAIRSENSARVWTGPNSAPRRHMRTTDTPIASTRAMMTLMPPGAAKSKKDASPAFLPALNAKPMTKINISAFTNTSIQIVELSRDFMPSSKSLQRCPRRKRQGPPQKSNARSRKNLEQSPQINDQRQPVVVAKHSDAMRHIFRSLFQKILGIDRIRADDFVRGDANAQIVVRAFASQRSNHHVLGQQSRAAAFRNRDVNQRHNGSAQIENAREVRRTERQLCQQWPVQDLLDIQHQQTKASAPAAENDVLRLRRTLFHRPKRFEQIVGIGGQRYKMKIFTHSRIVLVKLPANWLGKAPNSAQQVFPGKRLGDISIRTLLLAPILIALGVL